MTRFPETDKAKGPDPLSPALETTRAICKEHGLTFHLASDRQIVDDLWQNVAAHIWACKYGIAFFEDRRGRGINYNLSIEVGSMIVLGRRVGDREGSDHRRGSAGQAPPGRSHWANLASQ